MMIFYLTITYYLFTTVATENPTVFQVSSREVTDTQLFLNKEEAYLNYHRERALQPYRNYISVKLDSATICNPKK
jgi:hypothetical protein